MTALEMPIGDQVDRATLIRRINQLYHELVHAHFDDDHRYRHRVERRFWQKVGAITLSEMMQDGPSSSDRARERVVLDLACGTGFVSQVLWPLIQPTDRLFAMDLGRIPLCETIRKVRRTPAGRAEIIPCVADAQHIPLASGEVDLVAMNASLHHLSEPWEALRAIDRVLKPGGYFALGFEPNRAHFRSPGVAALSAGFNRVCWYASLRQNWRRLTRRMWEVASPVANPENNDDVLAMHINRQLLSDGVIGYPLSTSDVLDLVDPFARGARDGAGFDPDVLLDSVMRDYQPVLLTFSDYLGESARRWPVMRTTVDFILRRLMPKRGSLFSWLIRKPGNVPVRRAS